MKKSPNPSKVVIIPRPPVPENPTTEPKTETKSETTPESPEECPNETPVAEGTANKQLK